MRLAYGCRPRSSADLQKLKEALACELLVRKNTSEFLLPSLPVTQATTWEPITVAGSKPVRGSATWLSGPTPRMGSIFMAGMMGAAWGLRRRGWSGTSGSEAILTTSGSSVGRLASGMERKHGVVTRAFLGRQRRSQCLSLSTGPTME